MNRRYFVILLFLAAGCGRYQEVTLPPAGGEAREVRWSWEPLPAPVITRGGPGEFDSVDALNPAIVAFDGRYLNLYSGWDGKQWRTGLASSSDGLRWDKSGPILAPVGSEGTYIAANGAIGKRGGGLLYWYQAGVPPEIRLARSVDGKRWERLPQPVLNRGPRGAWDEMGVADPFVLQADGRYYMYFLGQDRARRQRLGVAQSDDGVTWTKSLNNPVLELGEPGDFDAIGLGEPAVWAQFGRWWMLYTGRDEREWRQIGLAVSTDGVKWKRVSRSPMIDVRAGWSERVVCDPEVEVLDDGRVRVWFGGGNRAEPAENLNGQIGVGWLRPQFVKN